VVAEQAESEFITLFRAGMGVTESYNAYRAAISDSVHAGTTAYGQLGIEAILANASICPTERQVRYMYAKFNESEFGAHNGQEMWSFISRYVTTYNDEHKHSGGCIAFEPPVKSGNEFLIAISMPLMTRVRQNYPDESKMTTSCVIGPVNDYLDNRH
jgi:hypothetical protein